MKCPMSFAKPDERGAWADCDPDCAWLVAQDGGNFCAVAVLAVANFGMYAVAMHDLETKEVDDG